MKTTKKLTPNKNNIETFCPIFTGFYGSYWDDYDFYGEAEHFNLPKNFPFYKYVNYPEYRQALCIKICEIVADKLSDFVEVIEFQSLYSPREYNFTNDSINCIIRPKKQAIKEYIHNNKKQFEAYLIDNFKSRDGFISFHSCHYEDWQVNTSDFMNYTENSIYLGSILNFIAENEKIEYSCLYFGTEGVNISEFYTDEFYKIADGKLNEVKSFINDNYNKFSNDELINQLTALYEDSDNLNIIIQNAKDVIKEIEDKTLTLELK